MEKERHVIILLTFYMPRTNLKAMHHLSADRVSVLPAMQSDTSPASLPGNFSSITKNIIQQLQPIYFYFYEALFTVCLCEVYTLDPTAHTAEPGTAKYGQNGSVRTKSRHPHMHKYRSHVKCNFHACAFAHPRPKFRSWIAWK